MAFVGGLVHVVLYGLVTNLRQAHAVTEVRFPGLHTSRINSEGAGLTEVRRVGVGESLMRRETRSDGLAATANARKAVANATKKTNSTVANTNKTAKTNIVAPKANQKNVAATKAVAKTGTGAKTAVTTAVGQAKTNANSSNSPNQSNATEAGNGSNMSDISNATDAAIVANVSEEINKTGLEGTEKQLGNSVPVSVKKLQSMFPKESQEADEKYAGLHKLPYNLANDTDITDEDLKANVSAEILKNGEESFKKKIGTGPPASVKKLQKMFPKNAKDLETKLNSARSKNNSDSEYKKNLHDKEAGEEEGVQLPTPPTPPPTEPTEIPTRRPTPSPTPVPTHEVLNKTLVKKIQTNKTVAPNKTAPNDYVDWMSRAKAKLQDGNVSREKDYIIEVNKTLFSEEQLRRMEVIQEALRRKQKAEEDARKTTATTTQVNETALRKVESSMEYYRPRYVADEPSLFPEALNETAHILQLKRMGLWNKTIKSRDGNASNGTEGMSANSTATDSSNKTLIAKKAEIMIKTAKKNARPQVEATKKIDEGKLKAKQKVAVAGKVAAGNATVSKVALDKANDSSDLSLAAEVATEIVRT